MGQQNEYIPGDWNATCSMCGRKKKASQMVKNWQGMYRCREHNEERHPQDFVRGIKEVIGVPWAQPPSDIEILFCDIEGQSAVPDYAIPDCSIPDRTNPFPEFAPDLLCTIEGSSAIPGWEIPSCSIPKGDALQPSDVVLHGSAQSATQVYLYWNPSIAPSSSIARYDIFQDGVLVGNTTSLSAFVTGLTLGQTYSFAIQAVAANGKKSLKSDPISLITVDNPAAAGFAAEAAFSVSGSVLDGGLLTIARSSGTFAPKNDTHLTHPETAWVWDDVGTTMLGGIDIGANSLVGEGDSIHADLGFWRRNFAYAADVASGNNGRTRLSRDVGQRHLRSQGRYFTDSTQWVNGQCQSIIVGRPIYPAGDGSLANSKLYVSWWAKWSWQIPANLTGSGGSDGTEDKLFRINNTAGTYSNVVGMVGTTGNSGQTVGDPLTTVQGTKALNVTANTWMRFEVLVDRVSGFYDFFVGSRYYPSGGSGVWWESRPFADWRYLMAYGAPALDTTPKFGAAANLYPGHIGWDDVTPFNSLGGTVSMTDVYVDTCWRRFEITNNVIWDRSPHPDGFTTSTPFWQGGHISEIQRVTDMDSTTVTLQVKQGSHSSLIGKYLWYVDESDNAELIGLFV